MINNLNAAISPLKKPFATEPVADVSLPRIPSGDLDIKSFTLLMPSSVLITIPLIISTVLLTFFKVGVNSVLTISVVSFIFCVSFDKS